MPGLQVFLHHVVDATIDAACQTIRQWCSRAEWNAMAAVRNGRVFVADGLTYFNRSSSRVVHSAEIVAEAVHPELAGVVSIRTRICCCVLVT